MGGFIGDILDLIGLNQPNGVYVNGEYFNPGTEQWGNLSTWSDWTDWSNNTADTTIYSKVFDFGTKKPVIPSAVLNTIAGHGYVYISYGDTVDGNDRIISPTTMGNDLYCDLGYFESGYVTDTITGFTARYAEVFAIIKNPDANGDPQTSAMSDVIVEFDQRLEHEYFFDIDTTDLAGTTLARTIPVSKLSTPVGGIFYSTRYDGTTSSANGKYQIHTISKSTPSFAVFDLDKFNDATGTDLDGIDIDVVGFPQLAITEGGGIGRIT